MMFSLISWTPTKYYNMEGAPPPQKKAANMEYLFQFVFFFKYTNQRLYCSYINLLKSLIEDQF